MLQDENRRTINDLTRYGVMVYVEDGALVIDHPATPLNRHASAVIRYLEKGGRGTGYEGL
jgi:hypothetical protein